ncbi:MAG: (2Fe-2S) ferredoxin domain-containing protein [Bacteroidales bacterium]|nr:(2Fe-2S) ferredoxin domain-containing protein [Bacteroidales bacterium]MCF8390488.1 (2Fe-2S) ferredoxin domain-containing protein [Bacteroidales bacterium]
MKTELIICMGSSCFARGNKKNHEVILEYIQTNNLSERVILKGNHCFDQCSKGPIIKINNKVYEDMNEERIIEILDKEFGIN